MIHCKANVKNYPRLTYVEMLFNIKIISRKRGSEIVS